MLQFRVLRHLNISLGFVYQDATAEEEGEFDEEEEEAEAE